MNPRPALIGQLLRLRCLGNWANLSTPTGLLVARLGHATVRRGPRGLYLAENYRLSFPRAGAFTVGNVIITGRRWPELQASYPHLLSHEETHTWQYLYCLGMPYYLFYSACMAWSKLRTGDRATGNFFERQAGLAEGGYPDLAFRPLLDRLRRRR